LDWAVGSFQAIILRQAFPLIQREHAFLAWKRPSASSNTIAATTS
jgi:hypothetical protein